MREWNGNFFIRLKKGGSFRFFSLRFLSFCFVVVLATNMNLCGAENYIRSIWWWKCVLCIGIFG